MAAVMRNVERNGMNGPDTLPERYTITQTARIMQYICIFLSSSNNADA
jgi:hypothetical protein